MKRMVEPQYKYAVYPGWVRSKNDNDERYVDFYRLCALYGVNPDECMMVIDPPRSVDTQPVPEGLIHLHPRKDGNYETPKTT